MVKVYIYSEFAYISYLTYTQISIYFVFVFINVSSLYALTFEKLQFLDEKKFMCICMYKSVLFLKSYLHSLENACMCV